MGKGLRVGFVFFWEDENQAEKDRPTDGWMKDGKSGENQKKKMWGARPEEDADGTIRS